MASDLLFFATIDEFDQIVSECHSCCDRSCEAERKLMSAIELTTGFLNKLKNYPGPYKWNYCPDFITDDELMDVELGTYLSIVSSLDGSNSRETALIARVSKMLADFSKAYEAQSGGGRTNNRASTSSASSATSGGCYIATCAYGSYDCPEVWTLRRFRDQFLAKRGWGRAFIRLYYALSPKVVNRFGASCRLRSIARFFLDRAVRVCQDHGFSSAPYCD